MRKVDANLAAGLLFMALGAVGALGSIQYGVGGSGRLGAGTFPVVVGGALTLVGLGCVLSASRSGASEEPILPFDLRSVACVTFALLFGGLTLRDLGVGFAVPGAVVISSLAAPQIRPRVIVATAAFLTAFTYAVFIYGLGVRLPLLPGGL